MGITEIRVFVTIITTITAIIFILMSSIFPKLSSVILSIEIILLPTIYILSNIYIEKMIKDKYNTMINSLSGDVDSLNQKYYEQRLLNERLKYQIALVNKSGKEKK